MYPILAGSGKPWIHAGAVVALASACGGARIGAAMDNSQLRVYEAHSGMEYLLTADVTLPSIPTDIAALPLPAPAFAVGCSDRCSFPAVAWTCRPTS